MATAPRTRSKTVVFLLGTVEEAIHGSKLPSIRQALGFFLHLHIDKKMTKKEAAAETLKVIIPFWNRARIPIRKEQHCRDKLLKLFETWGNIKKNSQRASVTQTAKEEGFRATLEDLFDIAHADALKLISLDEDRNFLLAQREKGRRGTMAGIDAKRVTLDVLEERRGVALERRREAELRRQAADELVQLASSSSSSSSPAKTGDGENPSSPERFSDTEAGDPQPGPSTAPPPPKRRATKMFVDVGLSSALDRTKMSNRQAVHVLSAAAVSLGHDPAELVMNRESFRRERIKFRQISAAEIKAAFSPDAPLTVHWDSKIVPAADGGPREDRLPVLVSGEGVAKLLAVPNLPNGTGRAVATAVLEVLEDWEVTDRVAALSFDTTSSNSGLTNGACTLIEQRLDREVLHLACRHHVLELVAEKAFVECMGPTSGPDVPLFKRFKDRWASLDLEVWEAVADNAPSDLLANRDDLIATFRRHLDTDQPRDDYRELLELAVIVLGGVPKRGIRFSRPGALHHARWMAKLIYGLKIYLFRSQLKLKAKEMLELSRFVFFAVGIYIPAWFMAPLAASAPAHDLEFAKRLVGYSDKGLAKATAKVFGRHLWYLSEPLVALAFFDDDTSLTVKRDMVTALEEEGSDDPPRRVTIEMTSDAIASKCLADFVTSGSTKFFRVMDIDTEFLAFDPADWHSKDSYAAAVRRVKGLQVINDFAERGVAMMQEFNLSLTKSEEQKQFLLQVVEEHRRKYPDARKATVTPAT